MRIYLLLLTAIKIFAHSQIVLVLSDDFNSSKAHLSTYEKYDIGYRKASLSFNVQLGKNGLGWGQGIKNIDHLDSEAIKKEGDGKAPAGIFLLGKSFGYAQVETKLEYMQATKELICVDDTRSQHYNKLIRTTDLSKIKSFEYMKREDNLYQYGLIVEHNVEAKRGAGSCIFMHIWRDKNSPTAGCTAMNEKNIRQLLSWLDKDKKPILIQIPKSYCTQVVKNYPGLICREEGF